MGWSLLCLEFLACWSLVYLSLLLFLSRHSMQFSKYSYRRIQSPLLFGRSVILLISHSCSYLGTKGFSKIYADVWY